MTSTLTALLTMRKRTVNSPGEGGVSPLECFLRNMAEVWIVLGKARGDLQDWLSKQPSLRQILARVSAEVLSLLYRTNFLFLWLPISVALFALVYILYRRWQHRQQLLLPSPSSRNLLIRRRLNLQPSGNRARSATDSSNASIFWRSYRPSVDVQSKGELGMNLSWLEKNEFGDDEEAEVVNTLIRQSCPYYGPRASAFSYDCSMPPPTWKEASKRLLSSVKPLQRTLKLCLENLTLTSVRTRSRNKHHQQNYLDVEKAQNYFWKYAVSHSGVHVVRAKGGVLHVYGGTEPIDLTDASVNGVSSEPQQTWHEFTFESSQAAAQFQIDVLGMQWLGKSIENLYNALALLHQGSAAHNGPEYTLHNDCETPNNVRCHGIAWDDAMRCLGSSFPAIGLQLESLWWNHTTDDNLVSSGTSGSEPRERSGVGGGGGGNPSVVDQYANKRLLLGRLDFFRLFVPALPKSAIPQAKSSKVRMEQLLRWRKRVARASLLVQSYVKVKVVAQRGWSLLPSGVSRRLAYDDPRENAVRDRNDENFYYEGTVSRDVPCQVRSEEYSRPRSWLHYGCCDESVQSSVQGYSLVAMHIFRVESRTARSFCEIDPVTSIPSLRDFIGNNPELSFFVCAWMTGADQVARVCVWARSLPRGIDNGFDNAVDRYTKSGKKGRDASLEVIFQIVLDSDKTSTLMSLLIVILARLFRFSFGGTGRARQTCSSVDRAVLPALRVSKLGETCHFGGSMQTDNMPRNYVATTVCVDSRQLGCSFVGRLLLCFLDSGLVSQHIIDSVLVMSGQRKQEFPERAFGTVRVVRPSYGKLAQLATTVVTGDINSNDDDDDTEGFVSVQETEKHSGQPLSRYFRILVTDPIFAITLPLRKTIRTIPELLTPTGNRTTCNSDGPTEQRLLSFGEAAQIISSSETFDNVINMIIEALHGVKVPVRRCQLDDTHLNPILAAPTESNSNIERLFNDRDEVVQVPILKTLNRFDILRYYLGSDCRLQQATVRLIESAAWRGMTFPIERNVCHLELQNGQFFKQGTDREGNPVFYFRNTCLGPWRGNENASIAAVLYRLESTLRRLAKENPDVKCTLIVLMGRPCREVCENDEVPGADEGDSVVSTGNENRESNEVGASAYRGEMENNPRICSDEHWHQHTNSSLLKRLIHVLTTHYPERLYRALVVIGHGNKSYTRTVLGGAMALSGFVASSRTRDKIRFLKRYNDLFRYVAPDELSTLVGGHADVKGAAFELLDR